MKKYEFNEQGNEFLIRTRDIPREWKNLHVSATGDLEYYSYFSHTGKGISFVRDAAGNKVPITPENGHKTIYLYERETDALWTPAGTHYAKAEEQYECRFTLSASCLKSTVNGMTAIQRCFVPRDEIFELWTLTLINHSDSPKTIEVIPYAELDLTGFPVEFAYHQTSQREVSYVKEINGLFAQNKNPFAPSDYYKAFMMSSLPPTAARGMSDDLLKPSYSFHAPNLKKEWQPAFRDGSYENHCLALKHIITLAPGETQQINFALGGTNSLEALPRIHNLISQNHLIEKKLEEVDSFYKGICSNSSVKTGISSIDNLMNYWLKKQMNGYLLWKNGFRDNLQIDMAYAPVDYDTASDNLIKAISRQYTSGHSPHWFRPVTTRYYSDKSSWILLALPELIKESGDFGLLDKQCSYLDEHHKVTDFTESIRDHLHRTIDYFAKDVGPHGIHLMHYADWNDGLDGLSKNGPGESSLVTFMVCAGLREVALLAQKCGDLELQQKADVHYNHFKKTLNEVCWDGEWYLRGFDGKGQKIGSKECQEGRIYLNPQTWAVLSGVANQEKYTTTNQIVDAELECEFGMKLLSPVYTSYNHYIGCISSNLPGTAENGVYNHASGFRVVAECIMGRKEKAWSLFRKILPDNPMNPVEQNQGEPFALSNGYRLDRNSYGEAGLSWRTGVSGWVYRSMFEYILGIRKDYDGLRIDPCIPSELKDIKVHRTFRGADYNIRIMNSNETNNENKIITYNGAQLTTATLPLANHGSINAVEVTLS